MLVCFSSISEDPGIIPVIFGCVILGQIYTRFDWFISEKMITDFNARLATGNILKTKVKYLHLQTDIPGEFIKVWFT